MLQAERDEAVARSKKLARQCDKLTVQLTDARAQIRDLNAQLADAAEYKVPRPAAGHRRGSATI